MENIDYKALYEEARERAKQVKLTDTKENVAAAEYIFPDLKESEDERIRKEIIAFIEWSLERGSITTEQRIASQSWFAYLEKQEQKPAEKQDYSGLTDFERAIHRGFLCAGVENVPVTIIKETAKDCLAHLPAEWSEEDKRTVNAAIYWLERRLLFEKADDISTDSCSLSMRKTAERLKSLRPHPHWKPSEEQMKALDKAIPVCAGVAGKDEISPLISLYGELKKLM